MMMMMMDRLSRSSEVNDVGWKRGNFNTNVSFQVLAYFDRLFHRLETKVDGSNARSVIVFELNSLFLLLVVVAVVVTWRTSSPRR
jgi:hypothetical protein